MRRDVRHAHVRTSFNGRLSDGGGVVIFVVPPLALRIRLSLSAAICLSGGGAGRSNRRGAQYGRSHRANYTRRVRNPRLNIHQSSVYGIAMAWTRTRGMANPL